VRRTLPALLAIGSLAGLAVATPAMAQPAPVATVDADRACPSDDITVTIDNPTQTTYEVTIEVGPITPTNQPPFETVQETIDPGEVFTVTFESMGAVALVVNGDGDFPDFFADPWFACPRRFDVTYTTPQDTAVEIDFPCSMSDIDLANGFVDATSNFTGVWTPDPGFVGQESVDYSCTASFERLGTMTFVVTPVQAPPPDPVVEPPTFTG
jgi:hypothetical protein